MPGLLIDNARAVKAAIDVPVIAVGRIDPDAADAAIADGAFDFVSMARMILAEPELPNLLAAGRPEEIRPCVYHYRCIGNIFVRGQVRCAANGSVGREDELVVGTAASPRSVLVVGGGPAGMEAARVAALRGHSVTLVDAGARLGGRWAYAAATSDGQRRPPALVRAPARAPRRRRCALGERLDADAVIASGADAVVVATGARWGRPPTSRRGPPARARGRRPRRLVGRRRRRWVVTSSCSAVTFPGSGVAERGRSRQGARVTVLEPSDVFGLHLGLPGRWRRVHDLRAAGIVLAGGAEVLEITPEVVRWRDLDGDHETRGERGARHPSTPRPTPRSPTSCVGRGLDVTVVGDAGVGAGLLEHAMRTALETAVTL